MSVVNDAVQFDSLEAARAAFQLGNIRFRCNQCGKVHESQDPNNFNSRTRGLDKCMFLLQNEVNREIFSVIYQALAVKMLISDKINGFGRDLYEQFGFQIMKIELKPIYLDHYWLALDRHALVEHAIRIGEQDIPDALQSAAVMFISPDVAKAAFERYNVRFWSMFSYKVHTRDEFVANLQKDFYRRCVSLAREDVACRIVKSLWAKKCYAGYSYFFDFVAHIESMIHPEIWWLALTSEGLDECAQRLEPEILGKLAVR